MVWVHVRTPSAAREHGLESDCRAERTTDQVRNARDQLIRVDGLGVQRLLARKSQQALGQQGRTTSTVCGGVDIPLGAGIVRPDPTPQQGERAHDDGKHVVEVVRDATGELADRLHLLRLAQSVLDLLELGRLLPLGGGVPPGRIDPT